MMLSLNSLVNVEKFVLLLNNYSINYAKESNNLALNAENNKIESYEYFAAAFNYF